MGTRRQARESALQMLYQLELSGQDPANLVESGVLDAAGEDARRFALELVNGVRSGHEAIDELISTHSTNWKLSRMAAVDKNILRIAVFELMSCQEIPTKVTINEAVEIAKKFGSSESGAFVNGILDNIAHELRGDEDDG
jgi:N utilization substance protein B